MINQLSALVALLSTAYLVQADVFLHNPRGSNNRNCETNDDRTNKNRLFFSQNNPKGGYACPRAWPFACYNITTEAGRNACNERNADQNYDYLNGQGIADDDGVLDPRGTRTPKMYYYEGSELQIEWTMDHGCGSNPLTHCDVIIQYACEDTLTDDCGETGAGKQCGPRDGVPITNSGIDRGNAIYDSVLDESPLPVNRNMRDTEASAALPISTSNNVQSDPRFGRHEPLNYYINCVRRERNKGLYTADQTVREDARGTRQNPSGDPYGYECPEEAAYYPYWHPSPWKDIAILTDRPDRCSSLVTESQNVKAKYKCTCPTCISSSILVPNNKGDCLVKGGSWDVVPAHSISSPFCGPAPTTPVNQLANAYGDGKSLANFKWTIPYNVTAGKTCVLRLRYNISTGDPISNVDNTEVTVDGTWVQNGANSPLKDMSSGTAAYVSFDELPNATFPGARLGLAINTAQLGRTFQDRSYVFEIRKSPVSGECLNRKIYNLNIRGKRGNIVQTYPAVEYDYVPNELYLQDRDCIHPQWTGSDYNPARNANDAYGGPPDPKDLNAGRADRNNLVQLTGPNRNQPVTSLDYNYTMFSTTRQRKARLAFIDQPFDVSTECMPIEAIVALSADAFNTLPTPADYTDKGQNFLDDNNDRDRYYRNCGKLSNARTPYFDGGLFRPGPTGQYAFMSTRTNSFSNRNTVGLMYVQTSPS